MANWRVTLTKDAQKDVVKLKRSGLLKRAEPLLELLRINPWQNPPPYEKLNGDLDKAYSRRLNKQHRLVYSVDRATRNVRVLRLWTHHE